MGKIVNPKRQKANRIPILIVEDNADQWLLIRSALTQCFPEAEPVWMNYGAQTLTYLDACSLSEIKLPRLILLDLYLPSQEEGWALLNSLKAHPRYCQIPIVVLSHSKDPNDILKAYALGVASYAVKPTAYHQWLNHFYVFRRYWWESVTLPLNPLQPG